MVASVLIRCYDAVFQINYFPSRYDPVRHAERFPIPPAVCSGRREKVSSCYFFCLIFKVMFVVSTKFSNAVHVCPITWAYMYVFAQSRSRQPFAWFWHLNFDIKAAKEAFEVIINFPPSNVEAIVNSMFVWLLCIGKRVGDDIYSLSLWFLFRFSSFAVSCLL